MSAGPRPGEVLITPTREHGAHAGDSWHLGVATSGPDSSSSSHVTGPSRERAGAAAHLSLPEGADLRRTSSRLAFIVWPQRRGCARAGEKQVAPRAGGESVTFSSPTVIGAGRSRWPRVGHVRRQDPASWPPRRAPLRHARELEAGRRIARRRWRGRARAPRPWCSGPESIACRRSRGRLAGPRGESGRGKSAAPSAPM